MKAKKARKHFNKIKKYCSERACTSCTFRCLKLNGNDENFMNCPLLIAFIANERSENKWVK